MSGRFPPRIENGRQVRLPLPQLFVQIISALEFHPRRRRLVLRVHKELARDVSRDVAEIARLVEVLTHPRGSRSPMRRIGDPEIVFVGLVAVDSAHVDFVDETRSQEAGMDHPATRLSTILTWMHIGNIGRAVQVTLTNTVSALTCRCEIVPTPSASSNISCPGTAPCGPAGTFRC